MLCANLALNGITNAFARHAASGAAAGSIIVPPLDYGRPNNFGGVGLGGYTQGGIGPRSTTIDSLELPHVSLIKADAEGMELDVIDGGRETITRCKPLLYVENDRADRSAALIERIASLGYQLFWHHVPMFRTRNFYRNPTNSFGQVVSSNMLCLHESQPAQIAGLPPVEVPVRQPS